MNWQIAAGIAALLALILLFRLFSGRRGKLSRHPYQKNAALFSADDRAFFRPLKEALGEDYEIFGKLRVADIIVAKKSTHREDVAAVSGPLAGRYFDFVLCEKKTLAVVCAIQLHDKTNPAKYGDTDALQAICENLGLPLVRFPVKAEYAAAEIRDKLQAAMVKEPFYMLETDGRKEPRISNLEDMKF